MCFIRFLFLARINFSEQWKVFLIFYVFQTNKQRRGPLIKIRIHDTRILIEKSVFSTIKLSQIYIKISFPQKI